MRYSALKGFYDVERTIGCGGFAKVKLATHIATGEKVAIKIMEKSVLKDDLPRVKLELKALKTLSHSHICKLYQVIETDTHFFLIVEYCSGGELFDHIVEKNRLTETESRIFFRQIVSAVAYLHSFGYAHRDLKPENVLLDYAQNLKLIDFGLCARPDGGMTSPLFTSCGSPTYAAPELVLGKQYLGPEVDVWAMGVLLYALLAGFLPFDDQNIDSLYKKILSGKYEEPAFMSSSSKKLIRQMLQVDPKNRITVNELLSHHWLTLGILDPVKIKSDDPHSQDNDVISLMSQYHGTTDDDMWKHLKRWRYDYDTATYFLLLARKNRGLPLKISTGAMKMPIRVKSAETIQIGNELINNMSKSNTLKPINRIDNINDTPTKPLIKYQFAKVDTQLSTPKKSFDFEYVTTPKNSNLLSPDNFLEPRKPGSIRKPQKRIRSPNLNGDCSPVPIKKTAAYISDPRTPEIKTPGNHEGSGSVSARKVLGSIERSLHKVRHVLTPRKPSDSSGGPMVLTNKDLCNVSTTQCTDPEYVITELTKALQKKGIQCERKKGFTIRGKMEPNAMQRVGGGCSFELDICYLPAMGPRPSQKGSTPTKLPKVDTTTPNKYKTKSGNSVDFAIQKVTVTNMVGIRRKRLKGDSWCYKKVCEQVLALTSTELKKESDV
ncbi:PREDICTED: maternal embryonic leucine zipper kinase-like [Nicrophorus vespilloides]|uniref:non-specific serine/threonine protein kinase n=1 Tax=Nicrophorus vespilloides TaxID=110193 RepID=A0ABM1MSN3_NICVS|nr:PREDICTED: maternal embryonic leucine zipper kinase-like [Nicrophorus vespilloides]